MSTFVHRLFLGTTILALAATPASLAARVLNHPSDDPVRYVVVALQQLGGTVSAGNGISNTGLVAGTSNLAGDTAAHAVVWDEEGIRDLGTLGGLNSFAGALNDRGFIVGNAEQAGSDPLGEDFCHAGTHLICSPTVWHAGRVVVLPTLGGTNGTGEFGINNRNQAVGVTETKNHDPTCPAPQILQLKATVWNLSTHTMHALPPLSHDSDSEAFGLNEHGDVVGSSGNCAEIFLPTPGGRPVLWRNGRPIFLGSLGGTTSSGAFSINNRGQVVGVSDLAGDTTLHGFLWQRGVMTDLGTLPGDNLSFAIAINDEGLIVGGSCDSSGNCRAVIWRDGVIIDLNTLIPKHSGLQLVSANGVDARGNITGNSFDQNTGTSPAFVATIEHGAWPNSVRGQSNKVILPERIRQQILLQRRLLRFGIGVTRQP